MMKQILKKDGYIVVQITDHADIDEIDMRGCDEGDFIVGGYLFASTDEHGSIYPINITDEADGEPTMEQLEEWIENWG